MQTSPTRILCVDDHALIREGIAALINRQADMRVVADAPTGHEDVSLVDLRLPDMSGLEVIAGILGEDPAARILILSSYEGDVDIRRALSAGAMGYLLKGMPRDALIHAVREVSRGRKSIPPEVAATVAAHISDEPLTRRELEVLRNLATGARNKEIATTLGISEDTVKMHVKSILAKLGADDRTGAVTMAVKRGFMHL
jgi:DNA-binding NarL/FixJ family response regulator